MSNFAGKMSDGLGIELDVHTFIDQYSPDIEVINQILPSYELIKRLVIAELLDIYFEKGYYKFHVST